MCVSRVSFFLNIFLSFFLPPRHGYTFSVVHSILFYSFYLHINVLTYVRHMIWNEMFDYDDKKRFLSVSYCTVIEYSLRQGRAGLTPGQAGSGQVRSIGP